MTSPVWDSHRDMVCFPDGTRCSVHTVFDPQGIAWLVLRNHTRDEILAAQDLIPEDHPARR